MDAALTHDLNNDLTILIGLVSQLEDNFLVEKIVKVIDRIKDKVKDSQEVKENLDVKKVLQEIKDSSSNIKININSLNDATLKANKHRFTDVINNFIKNSKEAGSTEITIEIRDYSIIYKDNGKCSQEVVDSLNRGDMKSTKGKDRGQGTKNVINFCK